MRGPARDVDRRDPETEAAVDRGMHLGNRVRPVFLDLDTNHGGDIGQEAAMHRDAERQPESCDESTCRGGRLIAGAMFLQNQRGSLLFVCSFRPLGLVIALSVSPKQVF